MTRRRVRSAATRLIILVVTPLVALACSESSSGKGVRGDDAVEVPSDAEEAPDVADAVDAVRGQVEAMLAGDLDVANALRCDHFRFDTDAVGEIERDLAAVQDESGPLVLSGVDSVSTVDAPGDAADRVEYRITAADRSVTAWRALVERQPTGWCVADTWLGSRESVARDVVDALALVPPAPEEVPLPAPLEIDVPGHAPVAPQPWSPDFGGVSDGWTVAWQADGFGGARVSTAAFDSVASAQVAATDLVQRDLQVATSQLQGLPDGAVGFRHLGYGYLGVQPGDSGPVIDVVVLRRGNVVSVVQVAGLPPSDSSDLVVELARRSAETIGP